MRIDRFNAERWRFVNFEFGRLGLDIKIIILYGEVWNVSEIWSRELGRDYSDLMLSWYWSDPWTRKNIFIFYKYLSVKNQWRCRFFIINFFNLNVKLWKCLSISVAWRLINSYYTHTPESEVFVIVHKIY